MADIKLQVGVKIFLKNEEGKWLSPEDLKNQENLDIYVKEIIELGLI